MFSLLLRKLLVHIELVLAQLFDYLPHLLDLLVVAVQKRHPSLFLIALLEVELSDHFFQLYGFLGRFILHLHCLLSPFFCLDFVSNNI